MLPDLEKVGLRFFFGRELGNNQKLYQLRPIRDIEGIPNWEKIWQIGRIAYFKIDGEIFLKSLESSAAHITKQRSSKKTVT